MRRVAVALAGIAVCLTVGWLFWSRASRPTPHTGAVSGHSVAMENIERFPDGSVTVTLAARSTRLERMTRMGPVRIVGAEMLGRRWVRTDPDGTAHFEITLQAMDKRATTFSIFQEVDYTRKPQKVTWEFKSVTSSSLPLTVTKSGLPITLRGLYPNQPVESNRYHPGPGYRWICLCAGPGKGVNGARVFGVELEAPTPDGVSLMPKCVLEDSRGRRYVDPGLYSDRYVEASQLRAAGGSVEPNLLERTVSVFNRERASRMGDNRYHRAARRVKAEVVLLAFPALRNAGKPVDLTVSADIRQPGGSHVSVAFERIPLRAQPSERRASRNRSRPSID